MRAFIVEQDKVSAAVKKSHLIVGDATAPTSLDGKLNFKKLTNSQVAQLRRMMQRNTREVTSDSIRGTDLPTEYIVLLALVESDRFEVLGEANIL